MLCPLAWYYFQVQDKDTRYIVDIKSRHCDFRRWELTGIPCSSFPEHTSAIRPITNPTSFTIFSSIGYTTRPLSFMPLSVNAFVASSIAPNKTEQKTKSKSKKISIPLENQTKTHSTPTQQSYLEIWALEEVAVRIVLCVRCEPNNPPPARHQWDMAFHLPLSVPGELDARVSVILTLL